MKSPRFLIIGSAPRYGSRDEIIGSRSYLEAVAETRRWADVVAMKVCARYGFNDGSGDYQVEIVDTRPEPYKPAPYVCDLSDDLPF